MNMARTVLATALMLAVACPPASRAAEKKRKQAEEAPVKVINRWSGKVANDALRRAAPTAGFLLGQAPWEKLWQAWRADEPLPEVDFQQQMLLVFTAGGPNSVGCDRLTLDRQGNIRANAMSTLIGGPGFGYLILSIPRGGVKSVNGTPLPGVKLPPKGSRPQGPGAEPGAAADSPGASSPGEPGVVESSEDVPPYPRPGVATSPPLPVTQLAPVRPKRGATEGSIWKKPLVLHSEKEAAEVFDDDQLAGLTRQADFAKQFVLLFAWRGSGQDRLEYTVAESYPPQVLFTYKPGRTRDLREHVRLYALQSDVKWSVRQGFPGRKRGPSPDTPVQSPAATGGTPRQAPPRQ